MVRFPVRTGQFGEGVDRAVCCGKEGVGLQPDLCGERPGALGFALEPVDRLPVCVTMLIRQPGGEVLRFRDLGAVELADGAGGTDERTNDALQATFRRPLVSDGEGLVAVADHLLGGFPDGMKIDGLQSEAP